jgi:hypothetical protein
MYICVDGVDVCGGFNFLIKIKDNLKRDMKRVLSCYFSLRTEAQSFILVNIHSHMLS